MSAVLVLGGCSSYGGNSNQYRAPPTAENNCVLNPLLPGNGGMQPPNPDGSPTPMPSPEATAVTDCMNRLPAPPGGMMPVPSLPSMPSLPDPGSMPQTPYSSPL
ncbi:MAG: hypothetical protein ACRESW_09035 [Nevskiales bacterium]